MVLTCLSGKVWGYFSYSWKTEVIQISSIQARTLLMLCRDDFLILDVFPPRKLHLLGSLSNHDTHKYYRL